MLRNSPYQHIFAEHHAQFVDRLGFSAPLTFSTREAEHHAARNAVGLFDVYYQVAIQVAGADAADVLADALVGDTKNQPVSKVIYMAPCNESGGMIDDLTCFRLSKDIFWLFPTPSRVANVIAAVGSVLNSRHATITNLGYKSAYLSVQGPKSRELLQSLTDTDLSNTALPYFSLKHGTLAAVPDVLISRTGYSGELGYELFYPSEYAEHMLTQLLQSGRGLGAALCGLGALRSLRIEKRYPLYGLDVDETTSPIEAGLGWTVKLNKPSFVGRDALERQKREGVKRRLVLIVLPADTPLPDAGTEVAHDSRPIGRVTSADVGFSVGHALAMAYVKTEFATDGQRVELIGAKGAIVTGTVGTRAIYDPEGARARA